MSFGYSISDFISLGQLAWTTVQNARQAVGAHSELTHEVNAVHVVLTRLHHEKAKGDSILNQEDDDRRHELAKLLRGCRRVLKGMSKILQKYNALSSEKRSITKLWQRVRFGNGEMLDLSQLRLELTTHMHVLTIFFNSLSLSSQGRVERQLNSQGEEMRQLRQSVNWITASLQARGGSKDGSILTSNPEDDPAVWKTFRRELIEAGFSSLLLNKHKHTITSYVLELGDRGAMDDLLEEDEEEGEEEDTDTGEDGDENSDDDEDGDDDDDDEEEEEEEERGKEVELAAARQQRSTGVHPPLELAARVSWEAAIQKGQDEHAWILVNIQDPADPVSHFINGNIWGNESIKDAVKENFILVQYDKDSSSGRSYTRHYFDVVDMPGMVLPLIAIVDPRTTKQLKMWAGPFLPHLFRPASFLSELHDFLNYHSIEGAEQSIDWNSSRPQSTPINAKKSRLPNSGQIDIETTSLISSGDTSGSEDDASVISVVSENSESNPDGRNVRVIYMAEGRPMSLRVKRPDSDDWLGSDDEGLLNSETGAMVLARLFTNLGKPNNPASMWLIPHSKFTVMKETARRRPTKAEFESMAIFSLHWNHSEPPFKLAGSVLDIEALCDWIYFNACDWDQLMQSTKPTWHRKCLTTMASDLIDRLLQLRVSLLRVRKYLPHVISPKDRVSFQEFLGRGNHLFGKFGRVVSFGEREIFRQRRRRRQELVIERDTSQNWNTPQFCKEEIDELKTEVTWDENECVWREVTTRITWSSQPIERFGRWAGLDFVSAIFGFSMQAVDLTLKLKVWIEDFEIECKEKLAELALVQETYQPDERINGLPAALHTALIIPTPNFRAKWYWQKLLDEAEQEATQRRVFQERALRAARAKLDQLEGGMNDFGRERYSRQLEDARWEYSHVKDMLDEVSHDYGPWRAYLVERLERLR